ncbi:MAG: 3-dehydro-L-gulonate 2-dehydrogenase [Saprospiraceae bacterium]|nr:3-dehydro-L-gulonate 2-dehydrogenase [Saprospiraceae bacterium]
MLIPAEQMNSTLKAILSSEGFKEPAAERIAHIFTSSSMDGYHSHGINRFAEFVKNCRKGVIDPGADVSLRSSFGHVERWDGQGGAGPLNAWKSMNRAVELAKKHVLGCVALSNTNHWMRGGSYGWQAAASGCIAICFTNTMPNMPPWGGQTPTTGNNPIVIALPRSQGHIVIDMSLSQFSYGKLHQHKLNGTSLPFPGGYDHEGDLTTDPTAIIASKRILQTGYWKGSGLSLMIDLLAATLSGGKTTAEIGTYDAETNLSQVFICIDPSKLYANEAYNQLVNSVLDFYRSALPEKEGQPIYFPGERTAGRRAISAKIGIEVKEPIWEGIRALRK